MRTRLVGVALFRREVDDRHIGALAGEHHRDRAADPRVAAGDQGNFPLELSGGTIDWRPVLGTRRHHGFYSRGALRLLRMGRAGMLAFPSNLPRPALAARLGPPRTRGLAS